MISQEDKVRSRHWRDNYNVQSFFMSRQVRHTGSSVVEKILIFVREGLMNEMSLWVLSKIDWWFLVSDWLTTDWSLMVSLCYLISADMNEAETARWMFFFSASSLHVNYSEKRVVCNVGRWRHHLMSHKLYFNILHFNVLTKLPLEYFRPGTDSDSLDNPIPTAILW